MLEGQDMHIHKDVQIVGIHINLFKKSVVLVVKKAKAEKLMPDNLLCLSASGHFDDPIWATVVDGDIESNGSSKYFSLELVSEYNSLSSVKVLQLLCTSGCFVVAESSTHYRSYQPVLSALQDMNLDQMPFKASLVNAQMPQSLDYTAANQSISPFFSTSMFPKRRKLDGFQSIFKTLDASQSEAFQLALDTEIAIIQGPPGTGKTYIGSKLVEAFTTMSEGIKLPIMVVSYKNRALDDFLEHISHICPDEIARVGRTSSNSVIRECNLSELKKQYRMSKSLNKEKKRIREKAAYLIQRIEELTNKLESSLFYDDYLIMNG